MSTNLIDKMFALTGMSNLKILSLARNRLKRIEKLEDVADTLEQLWLSYNEISSLDGLQGMNKLEVLYMSNNSIKEWSELDKLVRGGRGTKRTASLCCSTLLCPLLRLNWRACGRCCSLGMTFTTAWSPKWPASWW